jgi:hypothetical protein
LEVLRICFPANLRHTLEELPKSLDGIYKRILNEINNANRVHAYRLLQCLTVALRPLRVEELAEVLAFDLTAGGIPKLNADWRWEDQEEAVLSACSSLVSVIVDDGSRVVQFSHFSVKEFLTSDRLASCMEEVSQFHIPLEPSNMILAQACLGVLLCLDDRTDYDSIPLYQYAAEWWVGHARVGNVESAIKDALDYFFDMDNPHFSALARIKHQRDLLRVSMDEKPTGVPRPAAPLYFAAWKGFRDLAKRLAIKHPQHVNQLGGYLGTPLHASLYGGHFEISQLLLAHGADINFRCGDNWTTPSLPLTTTFPLWKTTLRPEVTLPTPLSFPFNGTYRSSELVGASMVRSGIWDRKTSGKRSLGLRIPSWGSSRVRLVVRRVLEVQPNSAGSQRGL